MSSNETHIISLSNYEEWFVLYMDKELSAEQKKMVENFLLLHPHLGEELDLLLATKLPMDEAILTGKEELLSASMKLNAVDEALLLYIDDELPVVEKKRMEEKISTEPEYRLQYDLLQQTKVDPTEQIAYPDKKELYRRTERVILFPVWMRIAAVLILLLFGSYLMLFNQGGEPAVTAPVAIQQQKTTTPEPAGKPAVPSTLPVQTTDAIPQPDLMAKTGKEKREERKTTKARPVYRVNEGVVEMMAAAEPGKEKQIIQKVDAVQIDVRKILSQPAALNNSTANLPVTSAHLAPLNITGDPEESIVTDGDDKPRRTPAKGFFRKVSRFIERRTGIGTVNADNELWVGAVALKLN
jgi:hypothetical protein